MTPNGNLDLTDRCLLCDEEPAGVFKGSPVRHERKGRPICSECADLLRAAKTQKGHIQGLSEAIKTSHKVEQMLRNFVPEKEREIFERRAFLLDTLLRDLSFNTGVGCDFAAPCKDLLSRSMDSIHRAQG